jgi:methionyl-tRNA synthetase
MEPFIPFTAKKLWALLNMDGSVHEQTWNETKKELPPNHRINKAKPLFTKIEENEEELQVKLDEVRAKLKKSKA